MTRLSWRKLLTAAALWCGLPVLVTLAGFWLGQPTLLLLYLCAVLYTALHTGRTAVLACALLSLLLFNFFHTMPRFSLWMRDLEEIAAAAIFLLFALLAGTVASRLQGQLARLRSQREFLLAQVQLSQALQELHDEKELPAILHATFGGLFPGTRFRLEPAAEAHGAQSAWSLAWTIGNVAAGGNDLMPQLRSLREQVQTALDRMQAARTLKDTERRNDEEKLRSALLASVSHDLKTPLVTMMGAATSLRDLDADLSATDRTELLDSIISESQRLESYIQNLLDMTRLGHGELGLSRSWVSVEEIHHVVARRISRLRPVPGLRLEQAQPLPSLYVHAALIEQGLFNVIENALKAAGPDAELLVKAEHRGRFVVLQVCDHGPGLPVAEWEPVFDQFHTFSLGDRYEKGTGLGLSICRSIFRVHGGNARIVPPPPGFAHCVELSLPVEGTLGDTAEDIDP